MFLKAPFHLLVLFLVLPFFSCSSKKAWRTHNKGADHNIQFIRNITLTDAINLSKKEEKPIFLDIYTDWCLPCKVMEQEVYSDFVIAKYFNANFINIKAEGDQDTGIRLANLFQVRGYPTLIFLDVQGKLLLKHNGAASVSEFLELGEEARALFQEKKAL